MSAKFYDFTSEGDALKFYARMDRLGRQVGHPVQNPTTLIWTVVVQ